MLFYFILFLLSSGCLYTLSLAQSIIGWSVSFDCGIGHTHLLLPVYIKYIKNGAMYLNLMENEVKDVIFIHYVTWNFHFLANFESLVSNIVVFTGHTHFLLPFYLKYIKNGAMDLNLIENEVEDVISTHNVKWNDSVVECLTQN